MNMDWYWKIEGEGLSYWLSDYYDPEELPEDDPELAKLCAKAHKAYLELDGYLDKYRQMAEDE